MYYCIFLNNLSYIVYFIKHIYFSILLSDEMCSLYMCCTSRCYVLEFWFRNRTHATSGGTGSDAIQGRNAQGT